MNPPRSTYRLQLRPGFGFDDVATIAPYLSKLGVSHVYLSPHLQAASGSEHGYDVVDPSHVSNDLGGPDAHKRMYEALKKCGLGIIVDLVPNHMAIPGRDNSWWWDVLKFGKASKYAKYFDIDWTGLAQHFGADRVLLPVLGDRYGQVLARGELQVLASDDGLVVDYMGNQYPIEQLDDQSDLKQLNANPQELHELLEKQNYRLAYWRLAEEELGYRRFFAVNSLMALRAERLDVFTASHQLVADWAQNGMIDGLRIDHIDGLADPAEYLARVRELIGDRWLLVEKILEPAEALRSSWPVAGTTGYEALHVIDGLFVDPENEAQFTEIFRTFTGYELSWDETVAECKRFVLQEMFGSDVSRLTDQLATVCEQRFETRDFSRSEMRRVLLELLASLNVYRTYVAPRASYITDADEREIDSAIARAAESLSEQELSLVQFVGDILKLRTVGEAESNFVERFQQLSGPVMAKGVEDTACYRYNRFAALNEVGGEPGRMGVRPDQFHEAAATTQRAWPSTMVTSTTHDTKRSEDTRYRLAALSEIPDEWTAAINQWAEINEKHRRPAESTEADAMMWPDRNLEYLVYQTLVGAYPVDADRLSAYAIKAAREAQSYTTWNELESPYVEAVESFVRSISTNTDFQQSLQEFVGPLILNGRINSLAATTVKLTMPGVPDTYQGAEVWDHSLVDPDNRRAVDFAAHAELLASAGELPAIDDSGVAKLWLIQKLLQLRARRPESFDELSDYLPLACSGERSANVVAYKRRNVITVVPRLVVSLQDDWLDTSLTLPDGEWTDVISGRVFAAGEHALSDLLSAWPIAVFESSSVHAEL